jgi:hypothetical protein
MVDVAGVAWEVVDGITWIRMTSLAPMLSG